MSDEIFHEVEEDLRNERMRRLWRQFGPYVIGAAVLIVLVVAGNEAWRWWQSSQQNSSAEQFVAALDEVEAGNYQAGLEALDKVQAEGAGKYPALASFREAAALAQQGQIDEAVATYDAIAAGQSDQRLRELASLFAAYLLVDGGDPLAVSQRVGDLQVDGHPMRSAAREALGLAYYSAGDFAAAYTQFEAVANDRGAPRNLAQRVGLYLAQLESQGVTGAQSEEAAAATEEDAAASE
ncbi:tetratricopeptide repeat protein [Maritalea mediterranea]|uniref:Ancillary SecYEG translocon subunit n=1 Tax=Maritalea mediterranea TaxID=2909667 RepID=A0ABS9E846_9HYPH|nr:tetratricopeptide repeat protein [Maritalea mediterranea]MCF4098069.1 tetratricopeptide repeat protein [Maritalea mediterranea]